MQCWGVEDVELASRTVSHNEEEPLPWEVFLEQPAIGESTHMASFYTEEHAREFAADLLSLLREHHEALREIAWEEDDGSPCWCSIDWEDNRKPDDPKHCEECRAKTDLLARSESVLRATGEQGNE